jgi:hypothetical protein
VTYIRVKWIHSNPDYPVFMYSELDESRWEVRKVERFEDGRIGFASATENGGGTRLGLEPVPTLEEINADKQFEALEVSSSEFEQVWAGAGCK